MEDDFATTGDIVNAWRPLSPIETTRAAYWLEVASRNVRRRWPDVDDRLALPDSDPRHLDPRDVRDVVVALVLEVIGGPPVPRARQWSEASGSESLSVTIDAGGGYDPRVFAGWMVAIFEGDPVATAPLPLGCFPEPLNYDPMFPPSNEPRARRSASWW